MKLNNLKEELVEVHCTSMAKSAIIDFLRAENKQMREILGLDEKQSITGLTVADLLNLLRKEIKELTEQLEEKRK